MNNVNNLNGPQMNARMKKIKIKIKTARADQQLQIYHN